MTINEFAKLDNAAQQAIITKDAVLLDNYSEDDSIVKTYYLHGFFVEVISCLNKKIVVDITPYKRGFKMNSTIYPKSSLHKTAA